MSDHLFDGTFVEATSKTTGQKQTIPGSWIGDPVLGADFELSPAAKATLLPPGQPEESWLKEQIQTYAETHGVDLTGTSTKAEMVSAIAKHEGA